MPAVGLRPTVTAVCATLRLRHRDDDGMLLPEASEKIDEQLETLLSARHFLHEELLADSLEARTFGITAANVGDVLERRLQLLERATRQIQSATEAASVNEVPLLALGLGRTDLWKGYIPLALALTDRLEAKRASGDSRAFVLGINAPPGSGKSTLVQVLLFLISCAAGRPMRAVTLSSDDLYMTKAERSARGISSRLDPAAMDPATFHLVAALASATAGQTLELPRFNKGKDDREPRGATVSGPFDMVLFEGWRVGVQCGSLHGSAFDYRELNAPIELLLYLDADVDHVWEWKLSSSRRDHEREIGPWAATDEARLRALWEEWMLPFIVHFEQPLAAPAEPGCVPRMVMTKSKAHGILKMDLLRTQLRRVYDTHLRDSPTVERAGVVLAGLGRAESPAPAAVLQKTALDGAVSFDAFASAAEELLGASGEWTPPVLHRLVTSRPALPRALPQAAARDADFHCATARFGTDGGGARASLHELCERLGGKPSLLLVYANSASSFEQAARALSEGCGGAALHGCTSAMGTMCDGEFSHGGVCFGVRDESGTYVSAATRVAEHASSAAWRRAAASAARDALDEARDRSAAARSGALPIVLLHATPGHEEAILAGLGSVLPGAHVFGGSAADTAFKPAAWRVASGPTTLATPAIALLLMWPSVPVALSLSCLHQPSTGLSAVVSAVSEDGRRLDTLDGRKAADVYKEWVDRQADTQLKAAPESVTTLQPLARVLRAADGREHYFPLHPHAARDGQRERGSLGLFAAARRHEKVTLLRGTHAVLAENATNAAAHASSTAAMAGHGVSGMLAVCCAGVGLELARGGQQGGRSAGALGRLAATMHGAAAVDSASPPPFAGLFSFGEQGPLVAEHESCHANLMMGLLVFGAHQPVTRSPSPCRGAVHFEGPSLVHLRSP